MSSYCCAVASHSPIAETFATVAAASHTPFPVCCRYNQSGVTTLRFEADYSSLLHFSSAECVVELEVIEDKVIEVPVPANKTERAAANATDDAAGDKDKDAASKDAGADSKGDKDAGKDETAKADDEQQAEKKEGDAAAGGDAANATEAAAPANKTVFIKKTIQVPRRKVFHVRMMRQAVQAGA